MQDGILKTSTIISRGQTSPNLSVFTFYDENNAHILQARLEQLTGVTLGVSFVEGQLLFIMQDYPDQVFAEINSIGELIIHAPANEVYYIDNDGFLNVTIN